MNTYVKEVYQSIGMIFIDLVLGRGTVDLQIDTLQCHKKRLNVLLMAGVIDNNLYDYCHDLLDTVINFLTP